MTNITNWVKGRLSERTSLDGVMLIGVGVVILFAGQLVTIAAYAAIVYGAWTLYEKED